jgi:N6-adenosine-specific RNA methylase IME4
MSANDDLFTLDSAAHGGCPPASCYASLFQCIVADPPWDYPEGFATQSRSPGKWSGKIKCKPLPYPSMTLDAIKALPVASFADEHCRLWMWTTNRYLPAAFEVMSAWGFDYRQTLVWHKSDGNMGGSVAPNSAEFLLVGVRGNPPLIKKMSSAVVKLPQSKKHSRKPREWRWLIEEANPGPRLEMFARQKAPGWQINPHFPALRADPLALSGASRRKQTPSRNNLAARISLFYRLGAA